MQDDLRLLAEDVRQVFLVPPDFFAVAEQVVAGSEELSAIYKPITLAFIDNLQSVLRTLSIPFHYTFSQVQSLHHQRFLTAERIRALKIPGKNDTEEDKRRCERGPEETAHINFKQFTEGDGQEVMLREVLERLSLIKSNSESLAAARELTRQGVVLVWGAFEVLARDLFTELLNRHPSRVEMLLNNPSNRKRFGIEKLDWSTLSSFGFDLSKNVGTLLAQRADLDDIPTIKDAYGALFPTAIDLASKLADRRLWLLFQRRNLIVHRRGIVDHQYNEKTGETLPLGSQLWPAPYDVENYLEAAAISGTHMLSEVNNAG
jgi:hypothetical protein